MFFSYNWLKEFVDVPILGKKLAELLTLRTCEIDHVIDQEERYQNIVAGQILEIKKHPDADKLHVTKTTIGKKTLQIVCGGPNIYEGMYVIVALPGAKVKWHGEGDLVTLEPAVLRGVKSDGMICAADEVDLEDVSSAEGVADLSPLKPKLGMLISKLLHKDDVIFHVDNVSITHRPDLFGHFGMAREIAAILGTKMKMLSSPKFTFPKTGSLKVKVEAKKLCPRYMAVMIENVKVRQPPHEMQDRLKSVDHHTYNSVVDITNYVMEEFGQPLHAFDADKLKGGIVVRRAKAGETLKTLDGVERKLDPEMLMICDHEKPVAFAGIMGGFDSGISETTTRIVLEAATFDPLSVRRDSLKLGLRTDAVMRFEKSLDPNLPELAIKRACELILKIHPGARIASPIIDVKNFISRPIKVTVSVDRINSKIGVNVPTKEMIQILKRLGFGVMQKGSKLRVTVPSWRATKDVDMEDDIVEEIARMYGYEKIPPVLPDLPIKLPHENYERQLEHRARELFSHGLGFTETSHYSFYSEKDLKRAMLPEELHLKLENVLSEDQSHLRLSLLPHLLKSAKENLKNLDSFKLYELGRTYEDTDSYFPEEKKRICALIVRCQTPVPDTFFDAKGALEDFFAKLGVTLTTEKPPHSHVSYAHPQKFLYYMYGEGEAAIEIARCFELHPAVAKNFELEGVSIGVLEIDFSELAKLPLRERKFRPLPKFPANTFDVSVIVPLEKPHAEIYEAIHAADPEFIEAIKLFDLYQGSGIDPDKKSLSYKITLRAPERTVADSDMQTIQKKIFKNLIALGGRIRGL